MPSTVSSPWPSAWRTRSSSSGHCAGVAPLRPSPESNLRWTTAGLPTARAASSTRSSSPPLRPRRTSWRTAAGKSVDAVCSHASTGAVMPSSRRASASATWAVPSMWAPAASAARATCGAPWPYASALTTAIRVRPRARSSSRPTLCPTAARSTTALRSLGPSAGRFCSEVISLTPPLCPVTSACPEAERSVGAVPVRGRWCGRAPAGPREPAPPARSRDAGRLGACLPPAPTACCCSACTPPPWTSRAPGTPGA